MLETIKRTLLAGVGAAVMTKEKLDATMEEFVEQGRISSADARVMARKIAAQGRKEFVAASVEAGANLKKILSRADRETQSRIDKVLASVRKLDRKPAKRSSRAGKR